MANKTKKVALFVGEDITAHLVLNKIVPDIIDLGFQPVLFMPEHGSSPKADLPELKESAFFERTLINDVIYPYLNGHSERGNPIAPTQLAKRHSLKITNVKDINDPKFVEQQRKARDYVGALSIRCFQIFKPEHIEVWREKGFLLNLHPGVLPQYQGVLSVARTMADKEQTTYGWSLHHIDKGIDTGNIIAPTHIPIDRNKTVLMNTIKLADAGALSITQTFDRLANGEILTGIKQPPRGNGAEYYTYPTAGELKEWKDKDVHLVNPDEMTMEYVEIFSDATKPHSKDLKATIRGAIKDFYEYDSEFTQKLNNSNRRVGTRRTADSSRASSPAVLNRA